MTKPKQAYPTDLNETEWEIVMQYLPQEATIGRLREHGWRKILSGIFYILRTGGLWRVMPRQRKLAHHLAALKTVYHYFRREKVEEKADTKISCPYRPRFIW